MSDRYLPFPADGYEVAWRSWDGVHLETVTVRWENEGWTVGGAVGAERIEYAIRLSASWQVRQFLLFRDLDDPDLWLATDGSARWGEMNGAHRIELDGCYDIHLSCTPLTMLLPIRRLPLHVGDSAELPVIRVDPQTLAVEPEMHIYTRLATHRWAVRHGTATPAEFDVDEHGLVLDVPDRFRRVAVT